MQDKTFSEIHVDPTEDEIRARRRAWQACFYNQTLMLDADEAAALWHSILQTELELQWYREQLPVAHGTI